MRPSPVSAIVFAMPDVDSSAIERISHDEATRQLHVRFVGGRRYAYSGVPRRVYDAFLAAESKGAFFNHHIRDLYPYREERPA